MQNSDDSVSPEELYEQGFKQARSLQYPEAIDSFTQAIWGNSGEPAFFVARAAAHLATSNPQAALADFEQAAQLCERRGELEAVTLLQASIASLQNRPSEA